MQDQNFKNHARMVPGYHYISFLLVVFLLIGAIVNLVKSSSENLYSASLLVLVPIIFLMISYYARVFALRAQDRAIKAEENFRHYLLTGKPLSSELRMRQIIGLRFASDDEFPGLAERAVSEKMSEKEIKKNIITWKPDYYRV